MRLTLLLLAGSVAVGSVLMLGWGILVAYTVKDDVHETSRHARWEHHDPTNLPSR